MNKPEKLVFSEEATFTFFRGVILVPLAIVMVGFTAALVTSGEGLSAILLGLILPCAALSSGWLGWVGLLALIAGGHRFWEKHSINKMFEGQIWECWQFTSAEWQRLVESECNLISPKDEGPKAYVGALYSSIFGAIIAVILIVVGLFAVKDPELKTMFWIIAGVVLLIFLGAGLFQPIFARHKADHYRRRSLRFAQPRVWFAPGGIYHEALGYTSLKDLVRVTDRSRSQRIMQFTLEYSTESSTAQMSIPIPVPSGCEERAAVLARRYRLEQSQS